MLIFNRDTWQEIFGSIRKNKVRTTITVIGVLWGIFIYITLSGAAKGLDHGFEEKFDSRKIYSFGRKYITTLFLPRVLVESWKAEIHLVQYKGTWARNYLNETGFSTIALYGKNEEELFKSGLPYIGPLKIDPGIINEKKLRLYFVKTPDNFYVELVYLIK